MWTPGAAFREAWRDYGRRFGDLWKASALLSLPLTLVFLVQTLVAAHVDLPLAGPGARELRFVAWLESALTPGAVALLAADVRAGGSWGWRQAWERVARRAAPVITGQMAASLAWTLTLLVVVRLLGLLRPVLDTRVWVVIATGVLVAILLLGIGIFLLVPLIASIDRTGGFEALRQSWRVLARHPLRNVATLALAQVAVLVPVVVFLRILPPGEDRTLAVLLVELYTISVRPLLTLVALSVYCDASGAGAADLRAQLDAR